MRTPCSSCACFATGFTLVSADALLVALAELEGTVVVTADGRLLNAMDGTPFTHLLRPLAEVSEFLSWPNRSFAS